MAKNVMGQVETGIERVREMEDPVQLSGRHRQALWAIQLGRISIAGFRNPVQKTGRQKIKNQMDQGRKYTKSPTYECVAF